MPVVGGCRPDDVRTRQCDEQHQDAANRHPDTDTISRGRKMKRRIVTATAAAILMKAVSVFRTRATADTGVDDLISACGRCRHFRLLLIYPQLSLRLRSAL